MKGTDDGPRHPKMKTLIRKAERQLTRRRFVDTAELRSRVYASLIRHLEQRGVLPHRPFHAAACHGVTLRDIDPKALKNFIERARTERNLAISPTAKPKDALTNLSLLDKNSPTNAAVLLFGTDPQRFVSSAEIKCLHFHGTTVVKPIPSYKVFKGTLFEQVDDAVDFVMSKLNRAVGTRAISAAAPTEHEIPREVVAEAVVNAVAHRDYASAASIQVYVFVDRIEVWNPGELPPSLTPDSLWQQHPSLPRNPLIAEALFLAHYIEKVGTGTLDVIAGCQNADLPEPEFFQDGDHFVVRLWRDWLTVDVLAGLNLNDRQRAAVSVLRQQRRITTGEYQETAETTRATAKRDLEDLVVKGLLVPQGAGRGAFYELPRERPINGSIGSSQPLEQIGSETAQSAHPQTPATPKGATKGPNVPSADAQVNRATNVPNGPSGSTKTKKTKKTGTSRKKTTKKKTSKKSKKK